MTFIDYDSADHLRTTARMDLSQSVSAVDDVVTIKAADGGSQMRLGAQTHCAQGWAPITTAGQLRDAGFTVCRDEHYWQNTEPSGGGSYVFSDFTAYLEAYRSQPWPIDCLLTVDFWNTNYDSGNTPYSPAAQAAFGAYAAALVSRYPQIKAVEVWNEINGGTWTNGTFATDKAGYYKTLCQAVYTAVKAVRPDVTVVGGATVYAAVPFWEQLAANGALAYMDACSVHMYDAQEEWEGILSQLRTVIGNKPLWVTEMGGTGNNNPAFYARAMTILDSYDVHTAIWYLLRDYASQGFTNWGFYQEDGTPYEVRDAATFMSGLMTFGSGRFKRQSVTDSHLHAYQRGDTWIIWGTGHPVTVGADVRVRDVKGNAVPPPASLSTTPYVFDNVRMGENLVIGASSLKTSLALDYYSSDWSYFAKDASTGALTALTWVSNGFSYRWGKAGTFLSVSPSQMHPDGSDHALARYTVPATIGSCTVAFSFQVGDSNSNGVTAAILKNGVSQWSQTVLPTALVSSSVSLSLSAGDTVDIDLGPNGSNSFDATSVTFTITT